MNRFVALVLLLLAVSQVGLAANVLVGTIPSFTLSSNEYLNQSGYYLLMQSDCNLVLFNSSLQPVQQSATSRTNATCRLVMQDDGNLVIYNFTGPWTGANQTSKNPLWAQGYWDSTAANRSFLLLRSDGSLEYYNTNSTLRPNSTFNRYNIDDRIFPKFDPDSADYKPWRPDASLEDFPYMPAGYYLDAGKKLLAKSERFSLELGNDCNLQSKQKRYSDPADKVLWNSSTGSADNRSCRLSMGLDGSLVILDPTQQGKVFWSSNKTGASNVSWILKLDPDDGSLTVSDITNKTNVLWTNVDVSLPPDIAPPSKSSQPVVWIVVGAVGGALVLATVALGLYFYFRRSHVDPAEKAFQAKLRSTGGNSQAFSERQIKEATTNYERVIGHGGFGAVFYGKLAGGQEVAAKVLSATSHQSKAEFYNEVSAQVSTLYLVMWRLSTRVSTIGDMFGTGKGTLVKRRIWPCLGNEIPCHYLPILWLDSLYLIKGL